MSPRRSALLVIDVQNDVVAHAHERSAVIANIAHLVDAARSCSTSVVWVQHDDADLPHGSDGWQIVPELVPEPDEVVIYKNRRSSFDGTDLHRELTERGIERLVITGAQTDYCVRWTLHGALARGYNTVLVADGHTTDATSPPGMPGGAELIAHTNSVWASQAADVDTSVAKATDVQLV